MHYRKTIGILGGMGPAATVNLFDKIVKAADVANDQDHPRIIIVNNPKIPDRTTAILRNGEDPLPMMVESARLLAMAHVDFIVIPCVTAHFFHAKLQEQISTPILHVVKETIKHAVTRYPGIGKIGLLATSGTIQAGLFNEACAAANVELITPDENIQTSNVMKAIYSVKADGPSPASKALISGAAETLIRRGAQAIIAGCTEIPLVLTDGELSVPVIDPLALLAWRAVEEAR